MSVPRISAVRLGGSPKLPLLVLGPSLGTSAQALWAASARTLSRHFEVLAWDLPGHGSNTYSADPFSIADLATAVLGLVDDMLAERGAQGTPFGYAGVSAGGAVGLELMLAAPQRVTSAVLISTGARIGAPEDWAARAGSVLMSGTPVMVERSARRWFVPGFVEREPEVVSALLHALSSTDREGYAQVCEALAAFDVHDRLPEVIPPVLAVAGAADEVTPPEMLQQVADGVGDGRLVVLDGVGHLAPAERPDELADLMVRHLTGRPLKEPPTEGPTDFTRDVQELVAAYVEDRSGPGRAWTGEVAR
jgi:3-oxoadipate enol-lactonase/4-carboxymuconolactone decarboxylase